MKRNAWLWLFISGMILFHNAAAQTNDSILTAITGKFIKYTSGVPREEIFIHFDKEEYVAGEDIWIKVFLIDRQYYILSDRSRIVYLEVLNSDFHPVIQKRILIADGSGPGHLTLPDTMSTGIYTIRAYTNWMKNSLPYNCYIKDIRVFNTLKRGGPDISFRKRNQFPVIRKKRENPGILLKINNGRSDSLEIILERSAITGKEDRNYLIIQSRGNIEYSGIIPAEKVSRRSVPKRLLHEGINHAVVFNADGMPVAEKLIYIPVKKDEILKINSESSFGLRDKIEIDLQPVDQSIQLTDFSISVAPFTGSTKTTDIQSYLVFGSEFNSEASFISENILEDLTQEEADSILSGVSSNWIRWPDILADSLPMLNYQHEDDYHFLRGYVLGGGHDTILMFSPGKNNSFQYTLSDYKGEFTLKQSIDEGERDFIFMLNSNYESRRIILLSSFSEVYPDSGYMRYSSEVLSPGHFSRPGIDFQVRTLFRTAVSGKSEKSLYTPLKPVSFYGVPDVEINLTEYIELPTMTEVFTELIPYVSLQKVKTGHRVVLAQRINDRRFVMYPSIMLDGVVLKDATAIAELDPALVAKIEIVTKRYLVGGYLFEGIVNVITKTGDFSSIQLPGYMVRSRYRIAEPVPDFLSPDYSTEEIRNSRIPDYRNVLYWNPSIPAENPVQFWSSDNKADYVVNIVGITGDGRPFSEIKVISVK